MKLQKRKTSGGADVTEPLERVQGDGDNTHSDLRRLAAAAEEPDSAKRWKRLQEVLDVDRFLSFAALEVLLCHWDGYTFSQHNYRVYHDLDSDKMVFFPHDMDQMMGDPSTPILPNANGLVSRAVLTTSEGRAQYRERFGTLFTNLFRASALSNRIHTLVAQLTPAIRACDPSMANEFEQMAATLTERIMQRSRTVTKLFQVPEPKPLHFVNGVAPLANWRSQIEQGSLELDRGQSGDQPVLRIQCNRGGGTASWRTAALLEPGTYRLLGRARTVGVVPRQDGRGLGGGVRISGEPRRNHLVGTADWVDLDHEFTVENDLREVVLVCELRAVQGEIWFDLNSLRLVRTGSER